MNVENDDFCMDLPSIDDTKDVVGVEIPKGIYLGLDISEHSSGVCIYIDEKRMVYNIAVNEINDMDVHAEAKRRRLLKEKLFRLIRGWDFDAIIIEDAFTGKSPKVARKLYSLNTAIDELILDGVVFCKEFVRVNNESWKSWLFGIDTMGMYRLYEDKLRIQCCLGLIGIHEEGEGYQDRLDATGMVIGYFLARGTDKFKMSIGVYKKVSWSDVEIAYDVSEEFLVADYKYIKSLERVYVEESRWSQKKVKDYLSRNPDKLFLCYCDRLGNFGFNRDLPYIEGGGVLAFWIKKPKLKKYIIQ